jgi:hypothetical protein
VTYDDAQQRYALPAEHVPTLATEPGPAFFGGVHQELIGAIQRYDQVTEAFHRGGGVRPADLHPDVWAGTSRFTARLAKLAAPVNECLWTSLETRTEAAYVRQALAGDWPAIPDPAPGELALVCRPDLDVYSGLAGLYRVRHGNLRADGAAAVLGRALAHGRQRDDALWFGPGPLPAPDHLAARYGDPAGLGVHMGPESARYLWLDRARGGILRRGCHIHTLR